MASADSSNAALGRRVYAAGDEFGKLTLSEKTELRKHNSVVWKCTCSCGNIAFVSANHLAGGTESCGCLTKERHPRKHGCHDMPEHKAWRAMIDRCTNQKNPAWHNYGGRGITACERWLRSFDAFLSDVGTRPSERHSLDRYPDNNGNYEPGNVRWATQTEQGNNRRGNVLLTLHGETRTVVEWSRLTGLTKGCIHARLRYGWSTERALTVPAIIRR